MPEPRVAAAVLLTRGAPERPEVYLVERSPRLRFFGGYWAMPGGVLEDRDGAREEDAALRRCAVRELFEETGVLAGDLGRGLARSHRRSLREGLLRGEPAGRTSTSPGTTATGPAASDDWNAWLAARPWTADDVPTLCEITTPVFAPVRYRTRFLHVELPAGETASVIPGELVQGRWFNVEDLLERWRRGELLVVPPVLFLLRRLVGRRLEEFRAILEPDVAALAQGRLHEVYFSPGIFLAPLRTPTIPPAVTTNCLLVGEQRVYVVDPATPHADEQERLFETMQRWRDDGRHFEAVLVTHHHPDHVGAVAATARRFDLPVRAHPRTLERLTGEFRRGAPLHDGDALELGTAPDGRGGWTLTAHHTPGHDQGHLVFQENRYGALIAGDLVSTLSTIVIEPPEGHLATYLDSLRRALHLAPTTVYPAHGPAHREGVGLLRHFLAHRQRREDRLLEVLGGGPATADELVEQVYDDTDPRQWPYAVLSLRAGLEKLEEEGRARHRGDRWELATPAT